MTKKVSDISQCCVIYARYSSHSQRDASIEQQVKSCRGYADKIDLQVVKVYADHAMTGTNDKRPEFQRMIKDAEKRAFAYVIVYTLDRFARDRYDSTIYKRQLKNHGVRVLSAMENISDDPTGVLLESLLEGLAEFYSKELSRKIRRGMSDNAEKCMANGILPLGYRRGSDGRYAVVESEAAIVREIYRRVSLGEPFSDIGANLNHRGIITKKGSPWNKSSFNTLLRNERYIGVYIYGDTRVEGGIPQIIEKELFDSVQDRLISKANPRGNPQKRRRENSVYLLTGKLFCGKCKSPMVGISGTSKTSQLHHYYTCRKRQKEKNCDKAMVRRDWVEHKITAILCAYALQDEVIIWLADSLLVYQEKHKETTEISALKSRLSDVQKTLKNVMSAIEQGVVTNTTKARMVELEEEESKLSSRIVIAQDNASLRFTKEQIVAWFQTFREGDVENKEYQELILNAFLVAAYLYDDHFRIVFNHTGNHNEIDIPFDIDNVEDEAETYCEVRTSSVSLHHFRRTRIIVIRVFSLW